MMPPVVATPEWVMPLIASLATVISGLLGAVGWLWRRSQRCLISDARCLKVRQECAAERDKKVQQAKVDTLAELHSTLEDVDVDNQALHAAMARAEDERIKRWARLERMLQRICLGQTMLAEKAGFDPKEFDTEVRRRSRQLAETDMSQDVVSG